MILDKSLQIAADYSKQTHHFLSAHFIAPTPINYTVIYLYITKENPKLTTAIDQKIKMRESISDNYITQLFGQFVDLNQKIEKTIMTPFENIITKTIERISLQAGYENKTTASLSKLEKVLTNNKHSDSLDKIAEYILNTINTSQIQHQALLQELSETQQEICQLKEKLASSRQDALVDALTGLLNRRGCDEKLKNLSHKDTHSSLAIDIDHFKIINDKYGHFIGDKVIQYIAKAIKDNINEHDLAVRYGGEEFVVVMVNKPITEAEKVAEKIRLSITKMKLMQRESKTYLPPISVSIGVAQNNNVPDWKTLFQQADVALYQAKNTGRNRCVCA
ncbi:MAG: GGDEF domain-containing protein [Colwellia sp.]